MTLREAFNVTTEPGTDDITGLYNPVIRFHGAITRRLIPMSRRVMFCEHGKTKNRD